MAGTLMRGQRNGGSSPQIKNHGYEPGLKGANELDEGGLIADLIFNRGNGKPMLAHWIGDVEAQVGLMKNAHPIARRQSKGRSV
jgi:hypothetical protein